MPSTDLDLTGRVGFVTGATRGIGLSTARILAAHGATLAVSGQTGAEPTARTLSQEFGVPVLGLACDNRSPEQIFDAYRRIKAEFGRLDLLVNNAGILRDAVIGMLTAPLIDEVLAVNTAGPILHLQFAARLMRMTGGTIVNVSSIIGVEGNAGQAVYAASKAAIVGLTKSAAKELAGQGIRVNAVAPGFIETDMTAGLDQPSIALGRAGQPEDVAKTILFLVSDLSAYVTGQVIGVDGGMLV